MTLSSLRKPSLERLEDRTVPATFNWVGGSLDIHEHWTGGDTHAWSNPLNWLQDAVPTATDSVSFSNTVVENYVDSGGNPFTNTGVQDSTSTVDGAFTAGAVAGFSADSTWGGIVNVNTSLALNGSSLWRSGEISVGIGSTLTSNSALSLPSDSAVRLDGGGTLANTGTLTISGAGGLNVEGSSTSTTNMVNMAGGTIDLHGDGGIYDDGYTNALSNAGTIEKTAGIGTSSITTQLSNTGTIDAETGLLQLSPTSGGLSGNSTFKAAAGAGIGLSNSFAYAGTITGTGNGIIALNGGTLSVGSSVVSDNAINLAPTLTFVWSNGDLSVPDGDSLSFSGFMKLPSSSAVRLDGGGTLTSNGTITISGAGGLNVEGDSTSTTTVVNMAGATIDLHGDGGIYDDGYTNALSNAGTIEKTAGIGTSSITTQLSNTGTIDAETGLLQLSPTSGGLSGNSTFKAAAGATIGLSNSFSYAGTITGTGNGIIALNGGTLSVGSSVVSDNAINLAPTLTFVWSNGDLSVPDGDSLSFSGFMKLPSSSAVRLDGGGTLTNSGTITISGVGGLNVEGSGTSATTLDNTAGATIDLHGNGGIFDDGYTNALSNAGILEKTAGIGTSSLTTGFSNAGGKIGVTSGTLQLAPNDGLSTGGVFSIAAGAVLDLTGGRTVDYSGTYTGSGAGTVQVSSGTLQVGSAGAATFNLSQVVFHWGGGTLDTNGSALTIGSLRGVLVNGVGDKVLTGGGSFTLNGTLTQMGLGNVRIDNGTRVTIAAGAVWDLRSNAGITDGGGAGGFLKINGTLRKSAGNGTSTVSIFVNNAGQVQALSGTLNLTGTVRQVAGNVLKGGSWSVFGGSTGHATLTLGTANLTTIGAGASVLLSGASSAFSNLAGLSLVQGSFNLLGRSFTTAGSLTSSGSLTLGPGSKLAVSGSFSQKATAALNILLAGAAGGSISVNHQVVLGGALKLAALKPLLSHVFTVLQTLGTLPISGTFAGLKEGAVLAVGKVKLRISYAAGKGRSVTLTRIS